MQHMKLHIAIVAADLLVELDNIRLVIVEGYFLSS